MGRINHKNTQNTLDLKDKISPIKNPLLERKILGVEIGLIELPVPVLNITALARRFQRWLRHNILHF